YAAMLKGYVNVDPYECILCGNRMRYANFRSGTPLSELTSHAIMSSKVRPATGF
ncbi:TPA: IS91 family transposase, partial [Vibrio vulnificus]